MPSHQDWKHLGAQIRRTRRRKGYRTQRDLAAAAGLSPRTISNYETGRVPETAPDVPDGYYVIADLFGWPHGVVARLLAGEEVDQPAPARTVGRADIMEALPGIYRWSRDVVSLGGSPRRREEFEAAAERLLESMPGSMSRSAVELAAYRPHAVGMGIPPDDHERIMRALDEDEDSE